MNQTRQSYEYRYEALREELSGALDGMLTHLEWVAQHFPFVILSGLIFLGQLVYYANHSMEMSNRQDVNMILISGVGCMCASVILVTPFKLLRTLQGVASFLGNALIMLTLSGAA